MKKLFLFTFIFFLAFVNSALAHTGLESSSPKNGDVINEELQRITLTFEGKVEQGSTFGIQNSTGKSISVENISLSENQIVGNFSNPLENGEYQVNWKIIGADGHPVEGAFSFSVDVPVTEETAEEQVKTQPQPKGEENEVDTINKAKDKQMQQNKMPSYIIPTIIGILFIIVAGSFLLMMKRKNRR